MRCFLTTLLNNINHDIKYLENYLLDDNHDNIVVFTILTDKLDERKKIVKLFKEHTKVIHKEVIDEKNLPTFVINEFKNEGYTIDYKNCFLFC